MQNACLRSAVTLALCLAWIAAPNPAKADAVDLALKLRKYYGRSKYVVESPKYLTNYQDCRARGASDAQCKSLAAFCAIQEAPIFGKYASLFKQLGLNQVFKLDCGSQECFQCCHVPGQGCHTSFIGFPVINCNPGYGEGTSDAGLTLVTDPDAMPGEACLTIPQTCDHIPQCNGDPNDLQDLRAELDNGGMHPVNAPNANENRAKFFGRKLFEKWCGSLDNLHTGLPRDAEFPGFETLVELQDFVTGRGCGGWRRNVGALLPFDWEAEYFAVRDDAGAIIPAASHLNGLCQLGTLRALQSVPNLGDRLSYVDSTVWPDAQRDAYLAMIGDPDEAILRHASPIVLDLLKCNTGVSDYQLLAVPLPGEDDADRVFNGCDLGDAPRVFLDAVAAGPSAMELRVEINDPEAGTEYAVDVPLTAFWGDGRVTSHFLPVGQAEIRLTHTYAQPGQYAVYIMAENTSGLRGFGAAIGETGAGQAEGVDVGPVIVSEVRLVNTIARADTLTGNVRRLFFNLEGHDPVADAVRQLGVSRDQQIDFEVDVDLGTLVAVNTGAAPLDRLILRPHWRDGFYTGFRGAYLRVERVEMHVFNTATGETDVVELPLAPESVRVFVHEQPEPLAPEQLVVDEMGRLQIFLHDRNRLTERIEIDLPQALLAANAPGPIGAEVPVLAEESWFEDRPEQFRAIGRGPDMGLPDMDLPDLGASDMGVGADGRVADPDPTGDGGSPREVGVGDGGTPAAQGGGDGGCAMGGVPVDDGILWGLLLALHAGRRRRRSRS